MMIRRHRPIHLLVVAIILLLPSTAAWPWPPSVGSREELIYRRQDNSNTESGSAASSLSQPTKTQADKSATVSETGSQSKGTTSATDSASASGGKGITSQKSGTITQKSGSAKTSEEASKTTAETSSTPIDDRDPAGNVVMITPAPNSPTEYYKIGDKVEFAWNYTYLKATPTAVNILVSCSANKATYTISNNATFETSARATWDTAKETGPPSLLTESYILIIHDADTAITAVPQPGHLAPFSQFRFGMYLRQTYVPKEQWVCATCSGALSDMERQTLKLVFGMCALTIFSFTWFVGGCNVWL